MVIWEYDSYKFFIEKWMLTLPKRGHGTGARIAKLLGIHTTMVSHILRGNSHFSVEQALKLSEELFTFNALETRYFVLLVQKDRAANHSSRDFFARQIEELRVRALNISERMPTQRNLEPKDQAVFYSDWYYSGIRLLTALPGVHTVESLAAQIELPNTLVKRVLEFLVETGLVIDEQGRFSIGEAQTYVGADSIFVNRHHANWRLRVLSRINNPNAQDLRFTNTVTLSRKDFLSIRELLIKTIAEFRKQAGPSPPENMACLTLDWTLFT